MSTTGHHPAQDLHRGWTLPGDLLPVEFSDHSVSAFADRVSQLDSPEDVRRELGQLLRTAVVAKAPPGWVNAKHARKAQAFLILDGGEMVLPLYRNRGRPGSASNGRRDV